MTSLNEWTQSLLRQPVAELNKKYLPLERDRAYEEVSHFLGQTRRDSPEQLRIVPEESLWALHSWVRGTTCEEAIWADGTDLLRSSAPIRHRS